MALSSRLAVSGGIQARYLLLSSQISCIIPSSRVWRGSRINHHHPLKTPSYKNGHKCRIVQFSSAQCGSCNLVV